MKFAFSLISKQCQKIARWNKTSTNLKLNKYVKLMVLDILDTFDIRAIDWKRPRTVKLEVVVQLNHFLHR